MAIDFPNSPTNGQTFTSNGRTWTYNGSVWNLITGVGNHASTHAAGAADPVTLAQSQVTNLTTDLASKVPYTAYDVAGKNKIINGAFDIWQRGAGPFTGLGSYGPDRFYTAADGGTYSATRSTFTPGTAPVAGYEGTYYQTTTFTASGGAAQYLTQKVEDVRTLAGQTTTLSFWAKASTPTSTTPVFVQNFGSGGSSVVVISGTSQTIGTTWTRYSFVVAMPTIATKTVGTNSCVEIQVTRTTTSATIDIWGIQWEAGSVATQFSRNSGTLHGELAACQRYYTRFTAQGGYANLTNYSPAQATTLVYMGISLPVTLRTAPTAIDYSGLSIHDSVTFYSVSAISLSGGGASDKYPVVGVTSSGLTQYRNYAVLPNGNPNAYLGFSAEL